MLTRRHLRIKVFQALYAYAYDPQRGLIKAEKQLRQSIDEIYRLYLYDLAALVLIHRFAKERIEISRQKRLPTQEDLNPNLRFVENRFLSWLERNPRFKQEVEDLHIKFGDEKELIRKIFRDFLEDERYQLYMEADHNDLKEDRKLVKYLYGTYLAENEDLHEVYEARNMFWSDDLDAAQAMVVKTITSFDSKREQESALIPLIKSGAISIDGIIADCKSGVSGAGRGAGGPAGAVCRSCSRATPCTTGRRKSGAGWRSAGCGEGCQTTCPRPSRCRRARRPRPRQTCGGRPSRACPTFPAPPRARR